MDKDVLIVMSYKLLHFDTTVCDRKIPRIKKVVSNTLAMSGEERF
ncbi:hypothetical protein bthur0007_58480 [Bacillus thuringiensis serovar monterrey BGSC 4AJ1]|nr:hypothetical protein bthur0007_58480 [Bacillus thuringiensis serovar monterrey BGSC 4AJ1]